jgi:hypothetical protein
MIEGSLFEFQADRHIDHLRRVVIPAAEQRAMIEQELALLHAGPSPRPAPLRWIGDRLVRLGERLRAGAAPTATPQPGR